MIPTISSNIVKIYLFRFFREFWLIIPIIVPFYHSFGLTSTQILIIQSVFSLTMLLFEVPSGFFADVLGRKLTLIIGAAFLPCGLAIYAFSSLFWQFLIAEFILAIGFSMCSGTDSAILYDTLKQDHQESHYHKKEGATESFGRIGSTVASIVGGLLAVVSLRLPFYVNIITAFGLFIAAVTMVEPVRKKKRSTSVVKDIFKIVHFCFTKKKVVSIVLLMAAMMCTGIIGVWGYLIALDKRGVPLFIFGFAFAVFHLASAFASAYSHKIKNAIGNRWSVFILFLIPVDFFLIGIILHPAILLLAILNAFVWGFSTPFFLDKLNRLIKSDTRATVLSVSSMTGRFGFVLFSPLFGWLADHISLMASFGFLAVIFMAISLFALRIGNVRNTGI